MRNSFFLLFFILFYTSLPAQENKTVYVIIKKDSSTTKNKSNIDWEEMIFTQADLSVPLVLNNNEDDSDDKNWFLPNGLGAKFGIGVEAFEILGVSLNTGIDWKINAKMVVVPVFGNARLNIELPNDNQITFQAGYGKGIALGRGSLIGKYLRYNIGYGEIDGTNLFIELSGYQFPSFPEHNFASLSLGVSIKM